MAEERVTFDEPHERLTEIAGVALQALDGKLDGLRAIVMIVDTEVEPHRVGTGLEGYDHPGDAFADLYMELRAIGTVMGIEVKLAKLGRG